MMAVTKFDQAYQALMVAKDYDEVKQIRDQMEALRLYLKQQGESLEMQNACAEIKIRAERRAGEILRDMPKAKGSNGNQYTGNLTLDPLHDDSGPTLKDLGISYTQSSRFQSIASIPEPLFEQYIAETKSTREELTTAGALRIARLQANPAIGVKECPECERLYDGEKFNTSCPYCFKRMHGLTEHWIEGLPEMMRGEIPVRRNGATAYNNHTSEDDPGYDGDEWYTPLEVIEAARAMMGSIDLDPATCEESQDHIQAKSYFTKDDDGLSRQWHGNVWLNPPYSLGLVDKFIDKVISEYKTGNVDQAIVLVNNSSETGWFHKLLSGYPACFPKGRLKFWRPHRNFATRQGQTIFYLGGSPTKFVEVFSQFGIVVRRYDDQ